MLKFVEQTMISERFDVFQTIVTTGILFLNNTYLFGNENLTR